MKLYLINCLLEIELIETELQMRKALSKEFIPTDRRGKKADTLLGLYFIPQYIDVKRKDSDITSRLVNLSLFFIS